MQINSTTCLKWQLQQSTSLEGVAREPHFAQWPQELHSHVPRSIISLQWLLWRRAFLQHKLSLKVYKKTDPRFHVNVHERRQGRVLRDSKNRGAMHGSCALPSTQTWDQHNTMPASPNPGRDGPEGYRVVMYHNAAETPRTTCTLPSPPLRILLAVKTSSMQSIVAVLCYHQDLHSVFKNWFFRTVTLPTFTTFCTLFIDHTRMCQQNISNSWQSSLPLGVLEANSQQEQWNVL